MSMGWQPETQPKGKPPVEKTKGAETMQRLIDANALKLALYYDVSKGTYGEFMDGSEVSLTDREILKLIDQQPTIDAEPHWIPVSERLPEDDVEVLVTDDSGGVQWLAIDRMLSYEDGSGRVWINSQNPIAWMPLPKPYEVKE